MLFKQLVTTPSVPQLTVRKLSRVFGGSGLAPSTTAVQRPGRAGEARRSRRGRGDQVGASRCRGDRPTAAVSARLLVQHACHPLRHAERIPSAVLHRIFRGLSRRKGIDIGHRWRIGSRDAGRTHDYRPRDPTAIRTPIGILFSTVPHLKGSGRSIELSAAPALSTGPGRGPPSPPAAGSGPPSAGAWRTACRSARPPGTGWRSSGAPGRPAAAPAAAAPAAHRR